jgi:hypothetical protein
MAIAKVQEKGYSPPSVAEFLTSGMANFTVGNTVIVNFAGSRGANISTISGGGVAEWKKAVVANNSEKPEDSAELWYGRVTSAGANVLTVTFDQATTAFDPLVVSEWSGVGALDKTSTNSGKSATMATTKAKPATSGNLFICIGRILEESKSGGPSGGWTEMSAAGHTGNASAFVIAAAAGEEATSWTITSDFWAMAMATFSPEATTGTMAGSAKAKFGTAAALSGQGKLAGVAKAKTTAKGTLKGEEAAPPSPPTIETRYRQQETLQPGRYMLRHIAPKQEQEGEPGVINPLGEGLPVLSKTLYANPLPISRLPDSPDFHEGSYTLRLLDSGEFTLTFPNRDASDGQPWRSRFSARGHTEYLEISREGEIETIGCILKVTRDRQKIMVTGYDGVFLLRKAYEQEWTGVIAPRDMIERYSTLWVRSLFTEFPAGTTPTGQGVSTNAIHTGTGTATVATGTNGGLLAKFSGTNRTTNRGFVAFSNKNLFTVATNEAWKVVLPFNVLKSVGGWTLNVKLSAASGNNALEADFTTNGLSGVASYFRTGGGTTFGYITPEKTPAVGFHTLTMECDGRWVFYYIDGELLAVRPAEVVGTGEVELAVVLETEEAITTEAEVLFTRFGFAQRQPFLMRGSEKGDYVLPGTAATYPVGGLHGRYVVQGATTGTGNWWDIVLAPDPRRAGFPEFIQDQQPELTGSQQPAGVPETYWAARWFGAIYLPLSKGNLTVTVGVGTNAGCRLWIGKTQYGQQLVDQWAVNASQNFSATVNAASLGGADGWYPIILEFFRSSPDTSGTCSLKFSPAATYTDPGGKAITTTAEQIVPSTSLSPLGCVDARVQGSSHFDLVTETARNYGYQLRAEARQLESGEFPCAIIPKARVGIETDEIIETDDRDQRSGMNGWSVTEDATDSVSSLKAFGSGIADGKGSQIAFEAISAQEVTQDLFDLQGWVNAGDIAFPALLAARAEAERELRSGVWQNIEGEPTARDRLADTFPLTGVLNQFRWRPGDGARLWLPEGSVRDTATRQLLQVTRNFNSEGRSSTAVGFRARPKDPTAALRSALREATRSPRAYQRNYTSRMGTFIQTIPLGIGAVSSPSMCTLLGNEELVDARVFISLNVSGKAVKLKINGTDRTTALGGPWTGPAVIDVREFATPENSAAGQRIWATIVGASESNAEVDFQLVLTLLV